MRKKFLCYALTLVMVFSCIPSVFASETVTDITVQVPVAADINDVWITLQEIEGYEYSIGGTEWQSSPHFDGLRPYTNYSFYQRLAAVNGGEPGVSSEKVTIRTLKSTVATPPPPTVASRTDTTITLRTVTGCEYSKNGTHWTTAIKFINLTPETEYTFYQRVKETTKTYASDPSEPIIVKTKATAPEPLDAPVVLAVTDTTIELEKISGAEYSIDGETWQDSNMLNDMEPLTDYTVYQRLKATDDCVASEATTCETTTLRSEEVPDGYVGIYDSEDLDDIRNNLDGNYILMKHIIFDESDFRKDGKYYNGGTGWLPIGENASNAFTGKLNGNGYTIQGIHIKHITNDGGYFGIVGYNKGSIRNLGIVNQSIFIDVSNNTIDAKDVFAGSLTGYSSTRISDCYSAGSVDVRINGSYISGAVGGIVGRCSSIKNCYNLGGVRLSKTSNSFEDVGGVAGGGKAYNCYNVGRVSFHDLSGVEERAGITTSGDSYNYYLDVSVLADEGLDSTLCGVGTSLTSSQMMQKNSYVGFDFEDEWYIEENGQYPYPQLVKVPFVSVENKKEFAGGSGTYFDPYIISTQDHLNNVRNYMGAYYKMVNDIEYVNDNEDTGWEPIGSNKYDGFFGRFDGAGHSIKGLWANVTTDSDAYVGLFGSSVGIIENTGVANGEFKVVVKDHTPVSYRDMAYAGGVVGYSKGSIYNCYNTNDVIIVNEINNEIYETYAGGIAGYSTVTRNCYNTGTVVAANINCSFAYASGIACDGELTENCYNVGVVRQVENSTAEPGGITCDHFMEVNNCYSIKVTSESDKGTIVEEEALRTQSTFESFDFENIWIFENDYPYPQLRSNPHVSHTENTTEFVGGKGTIDDPYLVATFEQLDSIRYYSSKHFKLVSDIDVAGREWTVIGGSDVDGFYGSIDGDGYRITGLNIAVNAKNIYTGFIGNNFGQISNIVFEDPILLVRDSEESEIYAGIICGYNNILAKVEQCKVIGGEVSSNVCKSKTILGGIVGYNNGDIKASSYSGTITSDFLEVAGTGYVGGIVGFNDKKGKVSRVCTDVYINGSHALTVTSYLNWGGVVGCNNGMICDAFSTGEYYIDGPIGSSAKGFVGGITGATSTGKDVENVYTLAIVGIKDGSCGTVCGEKITEEFSNAYYLATDKNIIKNGKALTNEELIEASSFVGFDFNNIWIIDSNDDYIYPQLREISYSYSPTRGDAADFMISDIDDVIYTGTEIEPEVKVSYRGVVLTESKDYKVTYKNNTDAGIATVMISGLDRYNGTIMRYFNILPQDVADLGITISQSTYYYDGFAKMPIVESEKLIEDKDYTISYANNVNVGTAKAYIIGKGNYTGLEVLKFTIAKSDISNVQVSGINNSYEYTGSAITPEVQVPGLVEGKDYEVSYQNNVDIGTATILITGIGGYSGDVVCTYKIKEPVVRGVVKLTSSLSGTYNKIKVNWTVESGSATGYKVLYKKSTTTKWNTKYVTERTITLSKLGSGSKYNIKVIPYKKVGNKYFYGEDKTTSIYTLKKLNRPTISKKSKNYVKVRWNNILGESGYQISRSTKKTGTYIVATAKTTIGKYKNLKVKRNKYYYYKVRAYKIVNGKKVYGPWSSSTKYKLR